MAHKSEFIVGAQSRAGTSSPSREPESPIRSLIEIAIVFALILAAVWTPQGRLNAFFSISAAACVVAFAIAGSWTSNELGLTRPLRGAFWIIAIGALLCVIIWSAGIAFRFIGAGYAIPWDRSWQYAIWALVQQFILQSIFFVRLEPILGGSRAITCAASLYAIAHVPSPVLTVLSFLGGLIFCELFRRYRNLFPLGIIHAALGLTIAVSLPDKWLHHMRVGIGYLTH